MTDTTTTRDGATDAELITAVRAGDTEAYGELFDRHRGAALRMARQLVVGSDADDLVAESFYRVLTTLQAGKGPDESFRAYLLTSVRRLHIDRIRAGRRVRTTDDESELDRAVAFVDPAEMRFEHGAAAAAFASLPERWQLVLWHLDVEGQKPAQVAPLLGMSANSVSALAYRAREGLRQAYLQGHLSPTMHAGCRRTTGLLGAYVRGGLSARDTAAVDQHLDDCSRCTGLYLELREVNANLSGVLGPALLGSAFGGYAVAGLAGGGVAAGAAVGLKVVAGQAVRLLVEPVKVVGSTVAGAGSQGVVAAAVVTTVATAGTVAATTDFGRTTRDDTRVSAPATPRPAPTEVRATPSPSRSTPATPVPTQDAPTPTVTPAEPAPTVPPSTTPEAEPTASDPAPALAPPAEAEPDPVVPTDYGVGPIGVSNDDTVLQRRYTIPVTAQNPGRAADQRVAVTVTWPRTVVFRGVVSPGWDCGSAVRGDRRRALTCTTTLPSGEGTTLVVKARGLASRTGSVTVRADGDPHPGNDTTSFRGPAWLLVL